MRSIPVRWSLLVVVLIAIVVYGGAGLVRAVRASGAGHDHTVFSAQLPNVPGKTLRAIVVEYAPGGSSPAHRHAGSVFAYVLSGQIRSENSATGPVRVYRAGGTFFEPPGSTHLVTANASDTEPALQVEHAHKKSQRAKILKLADKTSNLRAIAASPPPEWSVKRRLEYVDWARKVSTGLTGVSKWLEGEFEQAAKEAERSTVFHR